MNRDDFDALVKTLENSPEIIAEAQTYYNAMLDAMHEAASKGDDTQDGLAVMEAFATLIAQTACGSGVDHAIGMITFIANRAISLSRTMQGSPYNATHLVDGKVQNKLNS